MSCILFYLVANDDRFRQLLCGFFFVFHTSLTFLVIDSVAAWANLLMWEKSTDAIFKILSKERKDSTRHRFTRSVLCLHVITPVHCLCAGNKFSPTQCAEGTNYSSSFTVFQHCHNDGGRGGPGKTQCVSAELWNRSKFFAFLFWSLSLSFWLDVCKRGFMGPWQDWRSWGSAFCLCQPPSAACYSCRFRDPFWKWRLPNVKGPKCNLHLVSYFFLPEFLKIFFFFFRFCPGFKLLLQVGVNNCK